MTMPILKLRGTGAAKERTWSTSDCLRIGRDRSCNLHIEDDSLSRRHAEFIYTQMGWVVRDLGSTNGTLLNGYRLGRTDHKLQFRDVVQCGRLLLLVEQLVETLPPARPATAEQEKYQVKEISRKDCRAAVDSIAIDVTQQIPGSEQLFTLLRIGQHIHKIDSLDELLRASLSDIVNGVKAQRGAILLRGQDSKTIELRATFPDQGKFQRRGSYSSTLASRCFSNAEALLCEEVAGDEDLSRVTSIGDGAMGSIICVPLRSPRQKLGVLHLDRGVLMEPFTVKDMQIADALAVTISAGIEAALTLVDQQHSVFLQTVTALAQAIDCRDSYTGGHTQRVTDYALMLAKEMSVSPVDLHNLQIGTPLHDIGKIGVDDAILRKPGRLTYEEFEMIKTHPVKGVAILQTIPQLGAILPIVRNHHERWDGNGYPDRLAGEKIPFLARIVTVADVFDALTSARSYRAGMPADAAFNLIEEGMGTHFDPDCAAAFLRLRPELTEMLENHAGFPITIHKDDLAELVQRTRESA